VIHYPRFAARFAVLVSELRGKQVTVIGHQRPDADCIGSQVALCRVLRANGVEAVCMNPDKVPRRIKFLVGDTPFFLRDEISPQGRLAVFADCADHGRAGEKVREMHVSTTTSRTRVLPGSISWTPPHRPRRRC
jgi:bifunctional oligoribonuclease and PAP phosphatase NrnA